MDLLHDEGIEINVEDARNYNAMSRLTYFTYVFNQAKCFAVPYYLSRALLLFTAPLSD